MVKPVTKPDLLRRADALEAELTLFRVRLELGGETPGLRHQVGRVCDLCANLAVAATEWLDENDGVRMRALAVRPVPVDQCEHGYRYGHGCPDCWAPRWEGGSE